jgi:hypothetical protein
MVIFANVIRQQSIVLRVGMFLVFLVRFFA